MGPCCSAIIPECGEARWMSNTAKSELRAAQSRTPLRMRIARDIWRDRYVYLLILPGFVVFFVYRYLPMAGLIIAFKEFKFSEGILGSSWVGLKYFRFIFTQHPEFYNILRNTLLINLYKLVFFFPVPIVVALMLNDLKSLTLKKILQTVVYLPHFISWVIFGGIIVHLLSPNYGAVNQIIAALGGERTYFMAEARLFRGIVVVTHILKESGWAAIIYLAALAGVDPQLYDAATIDGANKWQRTWSVTIPGISATIVFILLLNIGRLMRVGFEQIYVMYNPAVYDTGDVISTYVYRVGIGNFRISLTAAIGFFQSFVGLILVVVSNWASKRFLGRSIW
jgi:putative aldouronate transport system permease protein